MREPIYSPLGRDGDCAFHQCYATLELAAIPCRISAPAAGADYDLREARISLAHADWTGIIMMGFRILAFAERQGTRSGSRPPALTFPRLTGQAFGVLEQAKVELRKLFDRG